MRGRFGLKRNIHFCRSPIHGAQPLGLPSSQQSSHQGVQARPAHPPPPKLARHFRLTKHAAVPGDEEGRWKCCWAHRENENYSHQCAQARSAHLLPLKLAQ